ncbi:MAG: hypothetical protein AAGI51_12370 [Pseudomonadota bacterium]
MSWLEAVSKEAGSIERLILALVNSDEILRDKIWRHRARQVMRRLRTLYWHEGGTLKSLREIAAGERPPDARLQAVRAAFYETDAAVNDALGALAELARSEETRLTFDDVELLDGIVHDKTVIRETARGLLESAASPQGPNAQDQADAAALVARIETLNAAFRAADDRFRDDA